MSQFTRRGFVQTALAASAALTVPAMRVRGANDAIRMGFIGVGGRGAHSVNWFNKVPGVRIATLCDADSKVVAGVAKRYPDAKTEIDLRKVIEDKDIDAVCISTGNHWHALAAIWACQAGKDVYVEKPVSHNLWEGRKIVEAARKYKRIVQGGTQQRSDPLQDEVRKFVHGGELGKIQYIRGNRFGIRGTIGKRDTPLTPPPEVNYDLWLGPAADEKLFREKFHYDWHWDWNTGNGEMGNWGVHILDDIRNVGLSDKCALPKRVMAAGGRILWDDAGQTPNVHIVYFDTGTIPVFFELSNVPASSAAKTQSPHYKGIRSGYVVQCEGGYYAGGRGGGQAFDNDGKVIKKFKGDGGESHARNFIEAIRSRKVESLKGEIEEIHYSSAWCHLANIGFLAGKAYDPAAVRSNVTTAGWENVVEMFEKSIIDNGLSLEGGKLISGPMLEIDPARETFIGSSATPANLALLTRTYRKGYEVPQQV
jgi:predicted dehydrogenase